MERIDRRIKLAIGFVSTLGLGTLLSSGAPVRAQESPIVAAAQTPQTIEQVVPTTTPRAVINTAQGLVADATGHYPVPEGQVRRVITPTPTREATAIPQPTPRPYIYGQAAECPNDSDAVNRLLRVGHSGERRVLVWVRPPGSLRLELNFLFGTPFEVEVPRGLIINEQFEGARVRISQGSVVDCLTERNPFSGRLGSEDILDLIEHSS